jgi:hypothetical protein
MCGAKPQSEADRIVTSALAAINLPRLRLSIDGVE